MENKLSYLGILLSILFLGASLIMESISYFSQVSKIPPAIMGLIFGIIGLATIIFSVNQIKKLI